MQKQNMIRDSRTLSRPTSIWNRIVAACRAISLQKAVFCLVVIISVLISIFMVEPIEPENQICRKNLLQNEELCRPACSEGEFSLSYMRECHAWLTCDDVEREVRIKHLLVEGTVKKVHLAEWNGNTVVVSALRDKLFQADFDHNLQMLRALSPSRFVVQLLGFCNDSYLITEYHQLGSAINVEHVLETRLLAYGSIVTRFRFCVNYVSILDFLHNSSAGVRVMCDSSTLPKTLSQYLLTDDLYLILNDMDALPEVGQRGVKCGHRELQGDFVAPEQRWPYSTEFDDSLVPFYDEKSDIWKVPDVCNWFLGSSRDADVARFRLFDVHQRCKEHDPSLRPSAAQILKVYETLMQDLVHEHSEH